MAVPASDPAALELDQAFAAAMAGPAKPRVPPPPDIDPDAPFGRGEDGSPLTPHGLTKEGKVRRSPAGRKSTDVARTAKTEPDPPPPPGPLPAKDYSESLTATSEAAWLLLTMTSMAPLDRVPILSAVPLGKGRRLGQVLGGLGDRLGAQAAIFDQNRASLVAALNTAAAHNARARRLAERLETGDATWALVAGSMVLPFLHQSAALWGGEMTDQVAALAKSNREHLEAWTVRFTEQLAAAQIAAGMPAEEDPA